MKIIEQYIQGKKNMNQCEDNLFINNQIVAVIDGVTAKGQHLWSGHTSGWYASHIIVDFFRENYISEHPYELLSTLSTLLKKKYSEELSERLLPELLRANIIMYNSVSNEIINYGDCQCIINGVLHSHTKAIDLHNSDIRAQILKEAIASGQSKQSLMQHDIGRDAIEKELQNQFQYENKICKWGYPVLNGSPIEKSYITVYHVHTGDEVVLATDGYPILCSSLKESEDQLHYILHEDPLCYKMNKATKGLLKGNISFDDRCYCRFKV